MNRQLQHSIDHVDGDAKAVASRVEQFAQGTDFSWVATLLEKHRSEILSRWLEAASTQPFHVDRPERAVADHIPDLVDALVGLMKSYGSRGKDATAPLQDPAILHAARSHALTRFDQGLIATDILTEFRLLRQEIGNALRLHLSDDVPASDIVGAELLVHDALDGAVFLALDAFSHHEEARRRAEEALRQSEEHFRLLVESVQDYAIFRIDPDGRVASWNAGAERLKGYTADEITGLPYATFFTPEDIAQNKPQRLLQAARVDGRAEDTGWRVRKGGGHIWVHAVLTALYDAVGKLRGYAKVTRDLSKEKEAEEARLTVEHSRETFLAALTHDVKNPLTSAMATAQLLGRRASRQPSLSAQEVQSRIEQINTGISRATGRLDDFMDLARLSIGMRLHLEYQPVDLVALARQIVDAHQAGTDQHELSVEATEEVIPGQWDRSRLERVLDNLVGNAIKYSPSGGTIAIRVHREGACAVVDVVDCGIGIPEGDQPQLFQQYTRASNAGSVSGAGLGLWSVRQLVEAHGGSVWVTSREGDGSTFSFRLPLTPPT